MTTLVRMAAEWHVDGTFRSAKKTRLLRRHEILSSSQGGDQGGRGEDNGGEKIPQVCIVEIPRRISSY